MVHWVGKGPVPARLTRRDGQNHLHAEEGGSSGGRKR